MSITESLTSMGLHPVKLLGEGAFGKVFHCTDASSGTNVAVKVCTEAQARRGAETEAALMSALPAHPNVVGVTSFNKLPGATVMAMPLATGGDTLKYMQERACTPLAETEVRAMFTQLVAAVEHLHSNGLVHRDIKCENILLSGPSRRNVLLADFGFAARYQKGVRALTEAYGSLHYSSPEICDEAAYEGPEVDIWSMGVVLYAWASGRLPFGGATSDEIAARIVSGNFAMHRNFSPELCDLIAHMLEVEPSKRATIADIKSSAWLKPAPSAVPKAPLVPQSTSVLHISRLANVDGEHRRRNSEADVKRPSRLSMALRTMFGK